MAIADGLKVQVYPKSDDTAVKNIVDNTEFTVTGTAPTLSTDSGIPVWLMNANTLLKKAISSKALDVNTNGNGITIALRFKRTTIGTNTYMDFAGVTTADGSSSSGVRLVGFDSNTYRGRSSGTSNTNTAVAPLAVANGNVLTLVYRFATLAASSSAPNMDSGAIWQTRVGRVGTTPDAVAYGNANTITIAEAMLNSQTGAAWTLFDFAYFDVEKSDADCAAIADDYRAVMPSPAASTPVAFTGTVPTQQAAVDTALSLDLSPYFSGTLTPFTYSVFSGTLPDGLTLSGSVISGTPTAVGTETVVIRATDTGSNTANTNAFDIVVDWALQPPQGTVTLSPATAITSTGASVAYSYSASDQTGFEYRLNGGAAQAASASPLVLTGLTALTSYTVEVRAVNSAGSGSWSSSISFTTSAAPQVPQGNFTVGTITTTTTTASVPYTYSASDQTSIQYRLNGGSVVTATVSPQALTALTANTGYTIEFRAVNATGNGSWSTASSFTTQPIVSVDGTITSEPLKRNNGTLLANTSLTYIAIYDATTGALVVRKTGVSTNASGVFTFTDPALTADTTYKLDWEASTGERRMPSKAAT